MLLNSTKINVRYLALLLGLFAAIIIAVVFHNMMYCLFFAVGAVLGVIKYDILSKIVPYITANQSNKKAVIYVVIYYIVQMAAIVLAFLKIKAYFVILFLTGYLVLPSTLYIAVIKEIIDKREEFGI